MEYLYAPWRAKYFNEKDETCPFCLDKRAQSDVQMGVIYRGEHCFSMMNLYPYSPGHFMILPYEHVENIEDLEPYTWQEMSELVRLGVKILKTKLHAKGVNIGMNLGEQAGAGIAAHCHYHLVPRWFGDTNFISTIANTRVCGRDLNEVYEILCKAYKELKQ